MIVKMTPATTAGQPWSVTFNWQSANAGGASQSLSYETLNISKLDMVVPFGSKSAPGIAGKLRFLVSAWNV